MDVSGVDRNKLIECLWRKSRPAAFFEMNGIQPPTWTRSCLNEKRGESYDYVCGRALKVTFEKNHVDHSDYDKYNGEGTFQSCVDEQAKH